MFAGVKTRFPLLLPILNPEKVVRKILTCIGTHKEELILPPFVEVGPPPPPPPDSALRRLGRLNLFGVNASMDSFNGRQGR
jgi:all-trans-retinol dehydrogenase (NAD+)